MLKKEIFSHILQEVAGIARVLSHPARLAILQYLADCNVCVSGDISREIPLSRTTVSQHLKILKNCGLIQGEIEGTRVHYCINPEMAIKHEQALMKFFKSVKTENNINCK
ncbi:MAG: metalloregulator ArsR/SmtB family transcription factor [Bacteroidota bacterium]|nr:metalloregulator ArsR/SmtB family transcription factor [Bacteroidota bacterium]